MFKLLSTVFVLLFSTALMANNINFEISAPLIQHLQSINKEWKTQSHNLDGLLQQPIRFQSDKNRIQLHLILVEQILRNRATDHLPLKAKNNRQQALDSLADYAQQKQFPINTKHQHRQPYFIDDYGTPCAVGHLLQSNNQEQFAKQISQEQNYAYIKEIQYPKLKHWATENGFSIDELAWIQPSYGIGWYEVASFNNPFTITSESINVIKEINGELYFCGDFIHFNNSEVMFSMAKYDGQDFTGFGIDFLPRGEIYDFAEYDSIIYMVGDFYNHNDSTKAQSDFVSYDLATSTVSWLNSSPITGSFKKIVAYECGLYIGGDFTSIGGNNMSYLAAYIPGVGWTQQPQDCAGVQMANSLSVNSPIKDLLPINGHLVACGQFTSASNLSVNGLAFYNSTGWWLPPGSAGLFSSVDHLETYETQYQNQESLLIGADSLMGYDWLSGSFVQGGNCMNGLYIPANTGRLDALFTFPFAGEEIAAYIKNDELFTLNRSTYWSPISLKIQIGSGTINCIYGDYEIFVGGSFGNLNLQHSLPSNDQGCQYFTNYVNSCSSGYSSGALYKIRYQDAFPVELTTFDAELKSKNEILLTWQTFTEQNSSHYQIERSTSGVENTFDGIGQVDAAGNSLEPINYRFIDDSEKIAKYLYYRLKMIDLDGSFEYSEIRVVHNRLDKEAETVYGSFLYPNPAINSTTIMFNLPNPDKISIKIYNMQGLVVAQYQEIATQSNHFIPLNISELGAGMYLVECIAGKSRWTEKLIKM